MSGHLINLRAYRGELVFAAKNSSENSYTVTAQLLLQRQLGADGVAALAADMERREVCVSFECVTSFNGDHGYPRRTGIDALLCTAIHSLSSSTTAGASKPWSYVALYGFCRAHALACTQTLLALDPAAARRLFAAYDALRHHFGPHARRIEQLFVDMVAQDAACGLDCLSHSLISDVVEGLVVRSVMMHRDEVEELLRLADAPPRQLDRQRLTDTSLRRWVERRCDGPVLTEEAARELADGGSVTIPVHRLVRRQSYKLPGAAADKEGASTKNAKGGAGGNTDGSGAGGGSSADDCGVAETGGGGGDVTGGDDGEDDGGGATATGDAKSPEKDWVKALLANPADDLTTAFVCRTLRTMQHLNIKARFVLYQSASLACPPPSRGEANGGNGGGGSGGGGSGGGGGG
ncbi:unnamed protein product, partial [Phaeothamnion confervicola]